MDTKGFTGKDSDNKPVAGPNEEPRKDAPGNSEVATEMDEHVKQGYRGEKVDDTPDEEYTVSGVLKQDKTKAHK